MSFPLKIVIVIQCVTYGLSLDCTQESKDIGIYVQRSVNGDRKFFLYNKLDRQWTFNLTLNGSDIVPEFGERSFENFDNVNKIFGTFFYLEDSSKIAVICKILIGEDVSKLMQLNCQFTVSGIRAQP